MPFLLLNVISRFVIAIVTAQWPSETVILFNPQERLTEVQQQMRQPVLNVIQEVETHWNGTFLMLKWMSMLQPITRQKPAMAPSGALKRVMTWSWLEQAQSHDTSVAKTMWWQANWDKIHSFIVLKNIFLLKTYFWLVHVGVGCHKATAYLYEFPTFFLY